MKEVGSLAGRRVVVTRRPEQAAPLVQLLRARGATVLEAPTTTLGPPRDLKPLHAALRDLGGFDWVVFTSANAVTAVRDQLLSLGLPPQVRARGPRLASVGAATTRVLVRVFPEEEVDVEPETDFSASGLVRAFESRGVAGASVLVPASSLARDELPSGLEALGARVSVVEAYATVPAPDLRPNVERCLGEGFDVITFAAPSAVEAFAGAAGERARGLPAVVIGPTTRDAAQAAGFRVLATAAPSTVEGLVEAVERALGPSA
jgi:uroporphyrinogen III methyltransferase/synthase